jgi:long-chain acyl-CoA synthetase
LWVLDMAFHFVVTILLFLRRRCTIVIGHDSLQGGFSQALKQHRITVLYATPVHYGMLASAGDLTVDVFADVRLAISTAMRLDASVGDRFRERFGLSLTQAYGIIEVGLPFVNESSSADKLVSVGRILPSYQVKFEDVDERGYGTILLRGKGMFDAYVSPFTLRADLCADGWFDTGDTGYLDEEGFLFIAGRNRSTINFAGTKVFPDEVEGVLLGHPDVAEARVLGRKTSGLGEVPVAEIVLANAEGEQTSVVREIRRVCFQKLAAYKVPQEIVVVDSIPKTASGKVQR